MQKPSITLVTGASGFIGRRLIRSGERAMMHKKAILPNAISGDLLDPISLRKACEGVHTIYHCAGYAHAMGSSNSASHWRVNYEGTRNLISAAGQSGVRRFVFLSSVKAMAEPGAACVDESWPGEPTCEYGKSKLAAEQEVLEAGKRFGMHVVNLRLALVYGYGCSGNLDRMIKCISAGWFPPLPETGNRRSLVHVDDVVEVIRLVVERPIANGKTYIVANSRAYSGHEIYVAINRALGRSMARYYIPETLFRLGGKFGDILELISGREFQLNSQTVDRLLGSACYVPKRINSELEWNARVDLAQGVREMVGPFIREKRL